MMQCGGTAGREMWLRVVLGLVVLSVGYSQHGISKVRLVPSCVRSYYRILVSRAVPPRNYHYFHETLAGRDAAPDEELEASGPQWRIVGGQVTPIQAIPFQVLYGLYCGGSLIAPNWVITAAHCKDKANVVLVGSSRRSQAIPYQICAHFIHPLWNMTSKPHSHDYDFQLLLLENPVPVTDSSRPIAIASLSELRPGSLISVSGWGHLHYKTKMQDLLRRVFIPIIHDNECKNLPQGGYKNITSRMFCAGYLAGSKDSCQGDSGGPAVIGGKLLGLVSFGIGCALPDLPGVYSLVPAVRSWIREVTALPL